MFAACGDEKVAGGGGPASSLRLPRASQLSVVIAGYRRFIHLCVVKEEKPFYVLAPRA